jgi:hypothetical protein
MEARNVRLPGDKGRLGDVVGSGEVDKVDEGIVDEEL